MPVPPALESRGVPPDIQSRLEAAGLRRTLNTRAVLGLFLARAGVPLSHGQALAALSARGLDINRVTLYRLLDRLVACGVLQRHADASRTWRFRLMALPARANEVAPPHFECDACRRQVALDDTGETTQAVTHEWFQALARLGHRGTRLDIAIHGTCATCMAAGNEARPAA
ncbi:MAG: Fur family transcriptional regulator [Hydrogenophaga sp.]|uniref:Fur family transcriptional regulator n=1 Tax=Hydrogenophaga sp. TaxID=1904254 RepID=UPI003D1415D9